MEEKTLLFNQKDKRICFIITVPCMGIPMMQECLSIQLMDAKDDSVVCRRVKLIGLGGIYQFITSLDF